MKNIFIILLLFFTLPVFGQKEYTWLNKGINIFLEVDGGGSREFGIGGPSLTIGWQFNPNVFLGCGVSTKFGGDRDSRIVEEDLGWYDSSTGTYHKDHYIDEKGNYHEYHSSSSYYYSECCDDGFGDMFMDFYFDFRCNVLAHSRYTPYLELRNGGYFTSEERSFFDEAVLGCRFGCGEGDFAIIGGAGYSYRRLEDAGFGNQHLFVVRVGVEF